MMHGRGNLTKAVELLDTCERKEFNFFLDNSVSFNPHNICLFVNQKLY